MKNKIAELARLHANMINHDKNMATHDSSFDKTADVLLDAASCIENLETANTTLLKSCATAVGQAKKAERLAVMQCDYNQGAYLTAEELQDIEEMRRGFDPKEIEEWLNERAKRSAYSTKR